MANRLKGASFVRATVMAAVFAVPLLGAGAAQAAIAGAPHQATSNRPDLVSATILTAVPGSVDFCFDKTLASVNFVRHQAVRGRRLPVGELVQLHELPARDDAAAAFGAAG